MRSNKLIARTLLYLAFVFVWGACERKDLYYPPNSQLQIITHWPEGEQQIPYYNEVIFYPTDGRRELRYYLNSDTAMLSLPVGEYNVIFYNWRTNASAQTVQFRNHHKYVDMLSFTGVLMNKSGYFDKYDIMLSPDMLFSWSTEDYTSSKVSAYKAPNKTMVTLHTYPKRVVHDYHFHVEVIGLEYVRAVSAVSVGFSPELKMYNKSGKEREAGHKLEVRTTESGFQCHFSAYNHFQPNDQRLHFVIKLPDGSVREYFRDLNKELDEKGTIEYVERIVIEYDGDVDPPPSGGGGFEPPEIGDWEGTEEDIVFPS